MWGENQPPPPCCLAGGFLVVKSDYKIWVQTKYSLAALTRICDSQWFSPHHLHLQQISPLHPPGKRVSCLFQLRSQFAHSIAPWLSKVACQLSLGCLWPLLMQYSLHAWPAWEPPNLNEFEPGGPPWLCLAFISFLWLLLSQSSLPHLTTTRTILSTWTQYQWSPLVFLWTLLLQSSLPSSLQWQPSFLSGLSIGGPPGFCSAFLLSLPFELSFACFNDGFCLFDIVYWFTCCAIVLLSLLLSGKF
jgi:hypothetical protein